MHQHQELHWLDIPERVNYKLRVLTHRCLLGKASVYLSNCCIPVSQVASRRHLLSAARHQLTVPRHRLSTYGRRAFAAAGPTMFNTLPDDLYEIPQSAQKPSDNRWRQICLPISHCYVQLLHMTCRQRCRNLSRSVIVAFAFALQILWDISLHLSSCFTPIIIAHEA